MSTLDLPQHLYVCADCRCPAPTGDCREHPGAGIYIEPTLTYADFQAYMTALSLTLDPATIPSDVDIWDRLESCTDTARSNREAIDNAIRWVVSQ